MEDPISRLVAARKLPIGDASRVAILWIQENLDFALEPFSTRVVRKDESTAVEKGSSAKSRFS